MTLGKEWLEMASLGEEELARIELEEESFIMESGSEEGVLG